MSRKAVSCLSDVMIKLLQSLKNCCFVSLLNSRANISGFPSIKKLTNAQIQSLIDKVTSMLPGWKAKLMNRAGRSVYVQSVMAAKVIYTTMAMDLPSWAIKAIEKLLRGFLWRGRKRANRGHCLLAWAKVARAKELRGLGIQNIKNLGWALRARWPWLQITDPGRPWAHFQIQFPKEVQSLIDMPVVTVVGYGSNTYF
jgi:hypothetical protein